MTKTTSKKTIASTIYAQLTAQNKTRKEILFGMVEGANLTLPGASTYYNNFVKGVWDVPAVPQAEAQAETVIDVVDTVEVQAIDFNSLSNAQLVKMYNERSETKVKKFRDHETAVRRTQALYA